VTTREAFLARVRRAERAGRGDLPPPPAVPAERGVPVAELADRFAEEATTAGTIVHRVPSLAAARSALLEIASQGGARRVVRGEGELLQGLEIDEALAERGRRVTVADARVRAPDAIRAAESGADLGLDQAELGIAESGTLVLLHGPGRGRGISLLPPVHVALLREEGLVADLSALFSRLAREGRALGSAVTLVTGPSRTADIEFVVTRRVHGPGELHAILVASA
jgi:L-lactate utilization protein LutC